MVLEMKTLEDFLGKQGIVMDDLIATALELFIPHPSVETEEKAKELLLSEFRDALTDVNVSCLVVACFMAERGAGGANTEPDDRAFHGTTRIGC
jgi:hypothetical protein